MINRRTLTYFRAQFALAAAVLCLFGAHAGAQTRRPVSDPIRNPADDPFKLGVSLDVGWFSDFSKRVGEQANLADSKGDDVVPGFGLSLELSPTGLRPLFTRVSLNYGVQNFEQTYNVVSPLDPTTAKGKVKGLFLDGQLGLRAVKGRSTVFSLAAGPTWSKSSADIDFTYADQVVTVNRVLDGWKLNAGASLWRSIDDRLGFQLAVTYTNSFKQGDADQNFRVSTGLTLGFSGGGN
ncbi:MAG: hypothetical protein ABI556_16245 [Gemmatimonadales bacterium]